MLAEIGLSALTLAFCAAIYAVGASVYGARRKVERVVVSARNSALLTFPLLFVAVFALLWALLLCYPPLLMVRRSDSAASCCCSH